VLTRALQAHGLQTRLERRLPLHVWTAAVGPEIALRARPTVLRAGALHVLVQDHRWRDQLDAARGLLMARLNEKLGRDAVRELKFGLAHTGFLEEARSLDGPAVARKLAAALPARGDAPAPRCETATRLVGDAPLCEEVRDALLRAASAAVRRARSPS
jgi:hypothetical protein